MNYKDLYCTNTRAECRNVEAEQLRHKNVSCLLINTELCHLTAPQQDDREGGQGRKGGRKEGREEGRERK